MFILHPSVEWPGEALQGPEHIWQMLNVTFGFSYPVADSQAAYLGESPCTPVLLQTSWFVLTNIIASPHHPSQPELFPWLISLEAESEVLRRNRGSWGPVGLEG